MNEMYQGGERPEDFKAKDSKEVSAAPESVKKMTQEEIDARFPDNELPIINKTFDAVKAKMQAFSFDREGVVPGQVINLDPTTKDINMPPKEELDKLGVTPQEYAHSVQYKCALQLGASPESMGQLFNEIQRGDMDINIFIAKLEAPDTYMTYAYKGRQEKLNAIDLFKKAAEMEAKSEEKKDQPFVERQKASNEATALRMQASNNLSTSIRKMSSEEINQSVGVGTIKTF